MSALSILVLTDGLLFTLIGLIVLAFPDPQPALTLRLDPAVKEPFEDTRRLLAAMFLASGLVLAAVSLAGADRSTLLWIAGARVASFAVVAAINLRQLSGGIWKAPPLILLCTIWALLGLGYLVTAILA